MRQVKRNILEIKKRGPLKTAKTLEWHLKSVGVNIDIFFVEPVPPAMPSMEDLLFKKLFIGLGDEAGEQTRSSQCSPLGRRQVAFDQDLQVRKRRCIAGAV
jgi:hypothetical protein